MEELPVRHCQRTQHPDAVFGVNVVRVQGKYLKVHICRNNGRGCITTGMSNLKASPRRASPGFIRLIQHCSHPPIHDLSKSSAFCVEVISPSCQSHQPLLDGTPLGRQAYTNLRAQDLAMYDTLKPCWWGLKPATIYYIASMYAA